MNAGALSGPSAQTLALASACQHWCDRVIAALRIGMDVEAAKGQALPHLQQLGTLAGDRSASDLVYVRVF